MARVGDIIRVTDVNRERDNTRKHHHHHILLQHNRRERHVCTRYNGMTMQADVLTTCRKVTIGCEILGRGGLHKRSTQ